ncbi:DUF3606 domain-containing protein [Pedobacter chinensis]|uniref:DUF3606 domain-containing protein n=1 Tax=Pedobacter chinensis TaxID=2282421 RepID=A0A369PZS4_9SPHI|nr:DUF3606 domain-containing protein [Pedobacter chinensis]RDC58143.1 DUF3606 domain-containing protein [Pedobacter chinensis]
MNNKAQNTIEKNEIIDISEEKDCNYWTNRLGVTIEVLKSAIRATRCVALNEISDYLSRNENKRFVV